MTEPTLHIVFSESAAGLLRLALRNASRTEQVLAFPDNLSFGPINPPDVQLRLEWMDEHLGASLREWDWLPQATSEFWQRALSASNQLTVWTSRRTTLEYSGFLEWVWRCENRTYDVIDLTDIVIERRWPDGTLGREHVVSLALLNPDQVQTLSFMDRAAPLSAAMRDDYRQMWDQLRAENAPFRIIRGGRLQSAPITVFDELVLSCANESWLRTARVLGDAMAESWDKDGMQAGDFVLHARVQALVKAGRLEGRGDLSDWRQSQVRLPPPSP